MGSPGHREQPGTARDNPGPSVTATFRILPRPTLSARRGTPVPSRESSAAAPALSRAAPLRAGWGKAALETRPGDGIVFKTQGATASAGLEKAPEVIESNL